MRAEGGKRKMSAGKENILKWTDKDMFSGDSFCRCDVCEAAAAAAHIQRVRDSKEEVKPAIVPFTLKKNFAKHKARMS